MNANRRAIETALLALEEQLLIVSRCVAGIRIELRAVTAELEGKRCPSCKRTWRPKQMARPRTHRGSRWDALCPYCYQRERRVRDAIRRTFEADETPHPAPSEAAADGEVSISGVGPDPAVALHVDDPVVAMTECPCCHAMWGMAPGYTAKRSPGYERFCGTCWQGVQARRDLMQMVTSLRTKA